MASSSRGGHGDRAFICRRVPMTCRYKGRHHRMSESEYGDKVSRCCAENNKYFASRFQKKAKCVKLKALLIESIPCARYMRRAISKLVAEKLVTRRNNRRSNERHREALMRGAKTPRQSCRGEKALVANIK